MSRTQARAMTNKIAGKSRWREALIVVVLFAAAMGVGLAIRLHNEAGRGSTQSLAPAASTPAGADH
jgi:hypothetical protein